MTATRLAGLAGAGLAICDHRSDCPFDPEGGSMSVREGFRSIEELDVPADLTQMFHAENARRLRNFDAPHHAYD